MHRFIACLLVATGTLILPGCAAALLGGASSGGYSSSSGQRTTPQADNDRAITTTVKSRLAADPATKMLSVHVDTHGGIVTLRGEVQNVQQRTAAQRVTLSVKGVSSVRNELRVR